VPKPGARGDGGAELCLLALSAPIKWSTIELQLADYAEPVARRLAATGLYINDEDASRVHWWQTLPYVLLIAFGTIKLMVGEVRGKPVGFLIGLLIVTAICAAIRWFNLNRRTQTAHEAIADAASCNERLKRAPMTGEIGTAVALFGTGVLAGSARHDFCHMRPAVDNGSLSGDSSGDGAAGVVAAAAAATDASGKDRRPFQPLVRRNHFGQHALMAAVATIAVRVIAADEVGIADA
jgi:hypothetical protein